MISQIKKQLSEYKIEPITKQNFEQIFKVYDSNQDFFLLTQGKKATIESSIGDIGAIPPSCTLGQKIYLGIWENDEVISILDIIIGYPEETCLWIGLFLVHGSFHSKGIGSKLIQAVFKAAKEAGYTLAQLGVIENNVKGIAFWQRHGFAVTRHSGDIIVMEKKF
ncbi:MAG: GNAT family N-acetyltransferase [Defluviitaleaceae bacterium]|nr:GNAT family N-acetyltransferase [Defluviitaleaceae bacterium]